MEHKKPLTGAYLERHSANTSPRQATTSDRGNEISLGSEIKAFQLDMRHHSRTHPDDVHATSEAPKIHSMPLEIELKTRNWF